jgi:trimethylamine:corrinoid methyltransferase-like protein
MADYTTLVKLAHGLPNQDMSGYLLVEPADLAAATGHLRMLHAHITHSDKPFIGSAGRTGAEDTLHMLRLLLASESYRRRSGKQPQPTGLHRDAEALVAYAQARQPMVIGVDGRLDRSVTGACSPHRTPSCWLAWRSLR